MQNDQNYIKLHIHV